MGVYVKWLMIIVGVIIGGLALGARAAGTSDYVPAGAVKYMPLLWVEQQRHWSDIPEIAYLPSLVEHESCISLKHKRCWNPTSELLTKREQGVGFGQITRAWRPDGTVRFDALTDMRQRYREQLAEMSWSTIKQRPDLQLRAMVLMSRENYQSLYIIRDPYQRIAMADAAYNGGRGSVMKSRQLCGLAANCDPQQWFNHTERYCTKSRKPLYDTRSACDIWINHPRDVLQYKLPKYRKLYPPKP